MVFCERRDCEYNDDGGCENPESIMLNDKGTCTDYIECPRDFWEYLDDVEQSEYMRTYEESEDEQQT